MGIMLTICLSGCAVQTLPNGELHFDLDDALLFGKTISIFKLVDGTEGRLREYKGSYSIKLQKELKVLNIPYATMARVVSATEIGGRTLLVLETSERNCHIKTHLFSIKDSEVLSWDFGDCRTQPQVSIGADRATFDFVQAKQTTRFTYRTASLMRSDFSNSAAELAPKSAPSTASGVANTPRYTPNPPAVANNQPATSASNSTDSSNNLVNKTSLQKTPAKTATPANSSAVASPQPATLPSAKAMDFAAQEQKPVRIVLDK
jgi:hypothetical protein